MKRPVVSILLALVLAVAAGVAVFTYTLGAEERVLAQLDPVSALVTTETIPIGTSLADAVANGQVDQTQVPANLRPADALTEVTTENGPLVAINQIEGGQMLMTGDFVSDLPATGPLAVPPDRMALSIAMGGPNAVGSFLRPGSRIAIFNSYGVVEGLGSTTRLLIPEVEVIAIGGATQQEMFIEGASPEGASPDGGLLVTMSVDQSQAQKIINASQNGVLYFTLLGEGSKVAPSLGVNGNNLFK